MDYQDYYAVLGVPRTASEKEIRAAYRAKARELHPDLHPGDKQIEEEFKRVNEAYEVLSNPEKRRKYDELGAHWNEFEAWGRAERQAGASGWPFGGQFGYAEAPGAFEDLFGYQHPFSDFFETFFGRPRGPRPGADVLQPISISLEEAYRGATRTLEIPGPAGNRRIEVNIPAGVDTGTRIRLAGMGAPGWEGGPPGDLYVLVEVEPSDRFERRGENLYTQVRIPLTTALLGGEVEVPTVTGRVLLKIPAETQNGRVFRLRGKGMPRVGQPSRHGDLFAEIYVELPRRLSEREKELVRELAHGRQEGSGQKSAARRKPKAA